MFSKRIFVTAAILTALTLFNCTATKKETKAVKSQFTEIDKFLQSIVDTGGVPGIAIAVTSKDDIIYSNAFGVSNKDTKEQLTTSHIFFKT